MYVLNSQHPLQAKMHHLFHRLNTKHKNLSKEEEGVWTILENLETNERVNEDSKDHGVGFNMYDQGLDKGNVYVPVSFSRQSSTVNDKSEAVDQRCCTGRFDREYGCTVSCQT